MNSPGFPPALPGLPALLASALPYLPYPSDLPYAALLTSNPHLEHAGPQLAGDEQPVGGFVVGDAVQHVGGFAFARESRPLKSI